MNRQPPPGKEVHCCSATLKAASVQPQSISQPQDINRARIYLCVSSIPDIEHFLESCIKGGVDIVQLREKHLEALEILEYARKALRVCHAMGIPFILNDRPDLALEVGADGVHVGQADAPPSLARRILGPLSIVGRSTHARAELDASISEPVDYISAGPVVPTPTKPGREGTGMEYVKYAVMNSPRPAFITGGVTPKTIPALAAAGATHYVVVRYLTESDDPYRSARALRDAAERALDQYRQPE
ncbi:MAG: thiamine phosphate synthase [Acidimicrobiales bacterium]